MHIALVSAYPPSKGSLNEYGYHLAQAFRDKPEVSKLSILADRLPKDAEEKPELHEGVERVWRFNAINNVSTINRALHKLKPDVVLYNVQFASFGDKRIPAGLSLLAPSISRRSYPTITLLHNIFETVNLKEAGFSVNWLVDTITKLGGRTLTYMLLKSDLLALTLPRYIDIIREEYKASNIFLAPHGMLGHAEPIAPLPDVPTVMTFGKFGTYKKVEPLCDAHIHLLERNPNTRLVIAGSDSPNAKGYLEQVKQQYQYVPNITFTGYVPEEDVPRIFKESTVVAFAYQSTTGSSGVLHQAGQYGRAAVFPNIGDLAELVCAEGYEPVTFDIGDVNSLAKALTDLLFKPHRAQQVGEANYRAATSLSISDVADWYLLHFQWLLKAQAKPQVAPLSKQAYTSPKTQVAHRQPQPQ